jgi:hypothetical protein
VAYGDFEAAAAFERFPALLKQLNSAVVLLRKPAETADRPAFSAA